MDLSNINAGDNHSNQQDNNDNGQQGLSSMHYNNHSRGPSANGRVPNLSRGEFDRLSREGRCFNCKGTGHLARNCTKVHPLK
jgi:excinuclease UvrABC ATPase subunit